jgi:hypothetical protein
MCSLIQWSKLQVRNSCSICIFLLGSRHFNFYFSYPFYSHMDYFQLNCFFFLLFLIVLHLLEVILLSFDLCSWDQRSFVIKTRFLFKSVSGSKRFYFSMKDKSLPIVKLAQTISGHFYSSEIVVLWDVILCSLILQNYMILHCRRSQL